jgi:hypothetical protein
METPRLPAPQDSREREIMENLEAIRDELLLLKQDRTKYIRTQDVMHLYDKTVEQVKNLNAIRGEKTEENRCETPVDRRLPWHATYILLVDKVLESCFQLISLFFMTIGRTSEAPAAYALTSTIKRLLDHLTEANLFSAKDLDSMGQTLEKLHSIVKQENSTHAPYLHELLDHRVQLCRTSLQNLQKKLDRLGDPLPAVHEKLISILRSAALANTRSRACLPG